MAYHGIDGTWESNGEKAKMALCKGLFRNDKYQQRAGYFCVIGQAVRQTAGVSTAQHSALTPLQTDSVLIGYTDIANVMFFGRDWRFIAHPNSGDGGEAVTEGARALHTTKASGLMMAQLLVGKLSTHIPLRAGQALLVNLVALLCIMTNKAV